MRNRWWLIPMALLSVLLTMTSQALLSPLVATAGGSGGVVSIPAYGMDSPQDVTTGPDGALWFTNFDNNTIGRITTAGVVTNYTGTGIDDRQRSRPDPTGRCGSPTTATTRSGGSPPPGW